MNPLNANATKNLCLSFWNLCLQADLTILCLTIASLHITLHDDLSQQPHIFSISR
ncbi:hypothetical protein DK880_00154 [Candidatus Cardinium hertigii]|uniref:Uncharacterized protein n=1 Tax=Candidatus Cardinium hertigii TaxID=247481 RepID=A0A2Z3LHG5_9BACT|nr:hypothetical protein DK880_00154 [Candidatus Cardinium hertigii]